MKEHSIFYAICRALVKLWLKLAYRLKADGTEQATRSGMIVAPNHLSHLDPMVVGSCYKPHLHYFARDTLFVGLWGKILRAVNVHPIVRGEADFGAMKEILALLKGGKPVVLFPEGKRSEDGRLQEGEVKPGMAMLAMRANCPILPVYVTGTFEVWPRWAKGPRMRGKVSCTFGSPLHPEAYKHLPKKEGQEALMEAWKEAMRTLEKEHHR